MKVFFVFALTIVFSLLMHLLLAWGLVTLWNGILITAFPIPTLTLLQMFGVVVFISSISALFKK